MGFFKKLFKGVKKVFKKIGKGIKKAVGKVGKFMGKLGIVGQIGLGLLLPGIGSMMGSMFGSLATSMMGSTIGIVKGAGHVINAAVNIGTGAGKLFSSITEGVTSTIGEITGTVLNKLGVQKVGTVNLTDKNFSNLWERTQEAFSGAAEAGKDLFSMDTLTADNVFMKKTTEAVAGTAGQLDVEFAQPSQAPALPPGTPEAPTTLFESPIPEAGEQVIPGLDLGAAPAYQPSTVPAVIEPAPSLLAKAGSAVVSRTKEAATDIPGQFSQAAIANLTAIPRDVVRSAMAPTPEVTYNVRQPAIPDIGFAGIGQEFAQPAFDPVSYFDQNQATFNQSPFGFGAALYGEATYARNMQSYGFQAPMYGMS
jgi:hypothetical protein